MIYIKNLIEEYYNIKVIKIDNCGEFYILNNIYYLYIVKNIDDANKQLSATSYIDYFYVPVFNKFNNIYLFYNNEIYILFKCSNILFNKSFLIDNELLLNGNCILDWKKAWKIKSDYINNFFKINNINNKYINSSIDYYLGLAESAIMLLDNYNNYYGRCSVCYICYDNKDFCNPLNTKIDLFERNVAEYLKILFYDSSYNFDYIDLLLYECSSYCNYNLVLARMIYPSNYFYSLEEFFTSNNQQLLHKIISMNSLYEKYIMGVYNIMCKYQNIKKISFT